MTDWIPQGTPGEIVALRASSVEGADVPTYPEPFSDHLIQPTVHQPRPHRPPKTHSMNLTEPE